MDLTDFSDDNYDAKKWVNKMLQNSESDANNELYAASLLSKLQSYMDQTNTTIEETSTQILESLPRIIHDTKILKNEALVLKNKMAVVKKEITRVERETGKSILEIEHLDNMKSKLEAAKQSLHEADNWTVLVNEFEEVFEAGNMDNILSKIVSMQQSLRVLINAPDFEDRKLHLEELKNRLEAMASTYLVQAFTSANIEQSCKYVKIFESIERLPQLLKYYHKCQTKLLLERWRTLLDVEQDTSVSHLMHNYYDILLTNWHTQLKWCNSVFPPNGPIVTLVDVYTDLLRNVDPSFNECIDAALKQESDKLALLLELKQITKQFASNLFVFISNANQAKLCKEEQLLSLAQAIYSPYVVYIKKYAAYEKAFLIQALNNLKFKKDELPDTIQALGMSVLQVFDVAKEAIKRCQQFTENCGFCGLIIALKAMFTAYIDQFRLVMRQIDRAKGIGEDWVMFKMCLTLLQNVGLVLNELQKFENELISLIRESARINSDSAFTQYQFLLLDPAGRREHECLIKSLTNEMTLMDTEYNLLKNLSSEIHHITIQVIIAPILQQLEQVKNAPAWSASAEGRKLSFKADLPDYSFAPQEYITQIGQYLMTLPQHLEPFLLQDNPSLTLALRAADTEYTGISADDEDSLADVLLTIIDRATCQTYLDNILTINDLTGGANKQLATDIEYFENILEDIGLSLSDQLHQIRTLLRLAPDEYQAGSAGCSARLVAAVRQMRNITPAT